MTCGGQAFGALDDRYTVGHADGLAAGQSDRQHGHRMSVVESDKEIVGVRPSQVTCAASDQVLDRRVTRNLDQAAATTVGVLGLERPAVVAMPQQAVMRQSGAEQRACDGHSREVSGRDGLFDRFDGRRQFLGVDNPDSQPCCESAPSPVRILEGLGNPSPAAAPVFFQQIVGQKIGCSQDLVVPEHIADRGRFFPDEPVDQAQRLGGLGVVTHLDGDAGFASEPLKDRFGEQLVVGTIDDQWVGCGVDR